MKKGQAVMEYVFLIGVAAAALVAILVYVGRGMQGNLRNQAGQLGALQYEPGKAVINNMETKQGTMISEVGSSSTVKYGNVNEPLPGLDAMNQAIADAQEALDQSEAALSGSGGSDAVAFSEAKAQVPVAERSFDSAGNFTWSMPDSSWDALVDRNTAVSNLFDAENALAAAQEAWSNRPGLTPNESSGSSYSSEEGNSSTTKSVSEELDAF